MNTRNCLVAAAALLLCTVTSQINAQSYTLDFDQNQYTVVDGGTVDVTVVLREEITGGQTARLAPGGDDGLFSFAIGTDYSAFTGAANGSTFNSFVIDDDFVEDFLADNGSVVSFEGSEDFGADADGEFGVGGVQISANVWEVEVGTLTFDAGDFNSVTTLQLQDGNSTIGNPVIQFGDTAAPMTAFGTSRILVVPEPGSVSLAFLALGAGLTRRKRR